MWKKKYFHQIIFLITVLCFSVAFFWFSYFSSTELYDSYKEVSSYRSTSFNLPFPTSIVRMISSGHDLVYADSVWINLIQFIGESFWSPESLESVYSSLKYITDISPQFSHAYELSLLLTPIIPESATGKTYITARKRVQNAINHAQWSISKLCDIEKIEQIKNKNMPHELWENPSLRNPCISWMVPYYLWMHFLFSLNNGERASYYYKIASMNDDAPDASKYLVFLAKTYAGNPFDSAISSLLMWAWWYDREPYECLNATREVFSKVHKVEDMTPEFISTLEKIEQWLKDTHSPNIPESNNATNCFDSFKRATKSFYIAYITEQWKKYPKVTDAQDFVKMGILSHIPTIRWQEGYRLLKRWSVWNFFKQ